MKFGTIAKYKVEPGNTEAFIAEMGKIEAAPPAGWLYSTTFQSTTDPNEIWVSIVFESEDAYKKSANSTEMDKQYRATLENLQGAPDWHDGHVIHEGMNRP
jgi:quinol monooxygenase YgiN